MPLKLLTLYFFISFNLLIYNILLAQYLSFDALNYRHVGPFRGGRVTAATGIADQPGTFLMGSTGGGVWKTDDYGQHWQNISDGYFQSPSIADIAVYGLDPNIIYVGTGSDGLRSNVISGKGVYKSINGGKSWTFAGLPKSGHIGAIRIQENNPQTVFAAVIGQAFAPSRERGVFRTRNGGLSWENVLFIADSIGCSDVIFHPGRPEVLYAGMWRTERKPWTIISGGGEGSGLYKSRNGGDSWTRLEHGLPTSITGKIDFAVCPTKPQRVWALIEAPAPEGGVYLSDDAGQSWKQVSNKKELLDRPFYYCNIYCHPLNPDVLYVSATQFWQSVDGGMTWKSKPTPHGDNHELWINPRDTNIWIQTNDGGATVTRDGGTTWSSLENQPTAELYQVDIDDNYPYWLYAGQQDNSTIMVPALPPYNSIIGATGYWKEVGGCETGPVVPKPGDPHIVYANCKGRFGVYNHLTGQEQMYIVGAADMYGHNPKDLKYRFQRTAPIYVSPHNPDVVYHCSQYVHRTTNGGRDWEIISPDLTAFEADKQVISGGPITRDITGEEFYSTIYAIGESPVEPGVIWTGSNDGLFYITRDGGAHWQSITPPGLPPGGRVQSVDASSHARGKAIYSVYRYLLGDWKPYVYLTEDYGASWRLLTNGKNGIPPDVPVRVVREDPKKAGLLFAGTEVGIYYSQNNGTVWRPLQQNLPLTPITDLKIKDGDLVLSTMGRGFWILDHIQLLRDIERPLQTSALMKPRDTHRLRYQTNQGPNNPDYLPPGVIIDYFISDTLAGDLTFEIFRGSEKIKTFKSTKGAQPARKVGAAFTIPSAPNYSEGFHRFYWNLSVDLAPASGLRQPLVAPGVYELVMRLDTQVHRQNFHVLIDPRVQQAGVTIHDLQEQEVLSRQIGSLMGDAKSLLAQLEGQYKLLQETNWGKKDKLLADKALGPMQSLIDNLKTLDERYPTPKLIDQIQYLYAMLQQADQKPGRDAYQRLDELQRWYKDAEQKYAQLDLPKVKA